MISIYLSAFDTEDDKNLFEELYIKYKKKMYSVAYSILHNVEDSEDAVHQAFLTIANNFEKVKSINNQELPSYIVIIIKRTAINLYNKNKRATEHFTDIDDSDLSIDVDFLANYKYELLLNAISGLSDIYKEILYLHYLNGFSTKEIAEMLDISIETVWKRIERAKRQLKARLEEQDDV